jgi:hypothetical protein
MLPIGKLWNTVMIYIGYKILAISTLHKYNLTIIVVLSPT